MIDLCLAVQGKKMATAIKFGKLRDLRRIVPYSPTRIKDLIKLGVWQEGTHFITDLSGDRLYNLPLIEDWLIHQTNPEAHQRAIDAFQNPINNGGSVND
jgi:hypothetical protein